MSHDFHNEANSFSSAASADNTGNAERDAASSAAAQKDGVEQFIEQMGMSAQADGVPRIAGRIFGYFIVHGGPVSFAQLAKELQVSRGSVSTNARILSAIGFIERVTKPGDRQDYYQLAASPYLRMIEGYLDRMRRMQHVLGQANDNIPDSMPATRARLAQMNHFYEVAVRSNEQLLKELTKSDPAGQSFLR